MEALCFGRCLASVSGGSGPYIAPFTAAVGRADARHLSGPRRHAWRVRGGAHGGGVPGFRRHADAARAPRLGWGWRGGGEGVAFQSRPAPPPSHHRPASPATITAAAAAHRACLCACYPAWAAGGIYICCEPCTYVSRPPSPSVGLCAARVWIAVAGALRARLASPGQWRPGGGQAAATGGGGPSGVRAADQPGGSGGDAVLVRGPATHQRRHLACQPRPD
jgi:hypothetical protein